MNWRFHPRVQRAVRRLARGRVIAYPTEAVWGLGCDPFNPVAVQKILTLKHRSPDKGLILVAAHIAQFDFILRGLDPRLLNKLEKSWPGPFTWLVPHRHRVPPLLAGRHDTIALRVSAHPQVQALCDIFGGPIVSTSANPQRLPPARTQLQARRYFGNKVFYLPGPLGESRAPSEIRDLTSNKIIRP